MNQAKRYNKDKPDLHYLHVWYDALCEVARVSMAGAEKYERGNFLLGQPYSELLGCAERHVGKFGDFRRPDYDIEPDANGKPGTGRHHIALAIWNLLQLLQHEVGPKTHFNDWDNRLRPPEKDPVLAVEEGGIPWETRGPNVRRPEDLRPLKGKPNDEQHPPVSYHPNKWTPEQRNRYPTLFGFLCRQADWNLGDESPVVHPFTGNPDDYTLEQLKLIDPAKPWTEEQKRIYPKLWAAVQAQGYEQDTQDMEAAAKGSGRLNPEPWQDAVEAWLTGEDNTIEVTDLADDQIERPTPPPGRILREGEDPKAAQRRRNQSAHIRAKL